MRVLVANSTQPKHPRGADPWVRATLHAIETLAHEGHSFVASLGTAAWELALWKIATVHAPVHILCPLPARSSPDDVQADVLADFGLQPGLCTWQFLPSRGAGRLKDTWRDRDVEAMRAAELLCPVSLRPGGKLESLMAATPHQDDRFRVAWQPAAPRASWAIAADPSSESNDVLVHFTRAWDGPWPGETRSAYYEAVTTSTDRYARDALATLKRIAIEKRLRASTFRIRGAGSTVSWTAACPEDALSLVRWRARYARFSFEPYAVAVHREAAWQAGARPVVYDAGNGDPCDPLRQGRGEAGHWEAEREWRSLGDVDLGAFAPDQVVLLTPNEEDADLLRRDAPFAVRAFSRPESRR